jgi:tetratricopeptide (TPR) repeat protein
VAAWKALDRALAQARLELALLRQARSPSRLCPPTAQDHERVEELWQRLRGCTAPRRRLLIAGSHAFQDWLLCVRLCSESERAAADDLGEALELAGLALFLARRVPGPEGWRLRLEGWATAFLANAQRIGLDLPTAQATFARAWRLWRAGKDDAGLLSEAYLLDLEASLRRAQRLFPRALKLHDAAFRSARREDRGGMLLNKSATLEAMGDYRGSLEVLAGAAELIDEVTHPRLRFGLRFNQAANLVRLGRAAEAEPLVEEARALAERLGNAIDLLKTDWLRGNLLAALGRRGEAMAALEEVRRGFAERGLPYNFALASLDLALLHREAGAFAEIAALASEILSIFEAQGVQREAIASVILFRQAADRQQITAASVQRLAEGLQRLRPAAPAGPSAGRRGHGA